MPLILEALWVVFVSPMRGTLSIECKWQAFKVVDLIGSVFFKRPLEFFSVFFDQFSDGSIRGEFRSGRL